VPNKTIYVREADTEVWEKAERLAGGSVSALIAEALRRYVEEVEQKEQLDMERPRSSGVGSYGPTRGRRGPGSLATTQAPITVWH
jgi:hypothetical protein